MKYLLLTLITLVFYSCSAKKTDLTDAPTAGNNETSTNTMGPFTVSFDAAESKYENTFRIPIQQNEGKVEYNIFTDRSENVVLEYSNIAVTGCDASLVKQQIFWLADEKQTLGQIIKNQSQFKTQIKTKGKIVYSIYHLNGCSEIELKIRLKKLPHIGNAGKACEGSTNLQDCRVDVYCKENYSSNFIEVEVWNRAGQRSVQKFMNHGDGSRSLMSMFTANFSNVANSTIYTSTNSSRTFLKYDNSSLVGFYSENILGNDYTNDLQCDL